MDKFGSKAKVMHGSAKQTKCGLTKKDLKYNKYGSIIIKGTKKKTQRGGFENTPNNTSVNKGNKQPNNNSVNKGNKQSNNRGSNNINENKQKVIENRRMARELSNKLYNKSTGPEETLKQAEKLHEMQLIKLNTEAFKKESSEFINRTGMTYQRWLSCHAFKIKQNAKFKNRQNRINKARIQKAVNNNGSKKPNNNGAKNGNNNGAKNGNNNGSKNRNNNSM